MKTFKLIFKAFIVLCCLFATEKGLAQNVGISASSGFTPDASAGLDISYTNKGLLVPRVALTATNAAGPVASPAVSLLVYNTATAGTAPNNVVPGYYYWNGTAWNMLSTPAQTASSDWLLTGNTGTNYKTNFLGTSDNQSLRFRTNNTQRFLLDSLGNAALGSLPSFSSNIEKFLVDAGSTSSFNVISGKGNLNNYLQLNIQNTNAGTAASSDVVATSDNGNESVNYVDMGINSSANTSTGVIGGANTAYLYSAANDFAIGNVSSGKNLLFFNGGIGQYEKMRIASNGKIGINVTDPANPLVVKDTLEIRRVGTMSELLFSNTGGSGDLRIAGDGGDIFWQGGGGRNLQMGSYWTTILAGDRQGGVPAFSNSTGGTGVLVLSQRDASIPLAIQANSGTQSANLTEWRTSSGTVLNAITKNGNFGVGITAPTATLQLKAGTATANTAPLKFTAGTNLTTPEAGAVEFDGTNYFATTGTTRYTLAKTLTVTATLDFTSTAANSSSTLAVTVTGAADADAVALGVPNGSVLANTIYTAYVSAANTVTVKFTNLSGSTAADPASGTFRVSILKY